MLTPPALSAETIIACLCESYGLRIRQVTFLPIGADVNSAVYRVDAEDGMPYFLKVKHENFAEVAVAVPAFLHAQGIRQVMAPLPTVTHRLWASGHGFEWILYPFFAGYNGFEVPLSDAQWVALGQSLKAVHTTSLPPALDRLVPRETYSPRWRDIVQGFDQEVESRAYGDLIAEGLAAFWITKRHEIRTMVARADELGRTLRQREDAFVLCHTDLHAWNVLVGAHDELAIVDWDELLFAPKERDLMFVGGGVGAVWDDAREEALFYQGYGATQINPLALSYYRYERIVADLAIYGAQIFEVQGSVEDRDEGLKQVKGQFLPNRVVAIAHQTYQQLPSSLRPAE
jgi:spectinomycin phosphotransferase